MKEDKMANDLCADTSCRVAPLGDDAPDRRFSHYCWDHQPRNACEAGDCGHHYC